MVVFKKTPGIIIILALLVSSATFFTYSWPATADGSSISGHVYESDGTTPIEGAWVEAFDYDSLSGVWVPGGNDLTDAEGYYEISALPPIDYGVRVTAVGYATEWYQDTYNQYEALPVTPPRSDIDFSLEEGGSISGNVTATGTGDPVSGVQVCVFNYDSIFTPAWVNYGCNMTDTNGDYVIGGLPDGDYAVYVQPMGDYIWEYFQNAYYREEADPVSVTAPDDTPDIDFSLELGDKISGHVYEPDGTTPIEGAQIDVFDYDTLTGWWVSYGGAQTDATGYYETPGLPSIDYGVQAKAGGYASEWYQDTHNLHEAVPVTPPRSDIDFSLELGGSISGNVIATGTSDPIGGVEILAFDYDSIFTPAWAYYGGAVTDTNGDYIIGGLPDGDYAVQVRPTGNYVSEYYQDTYYSSEADWVLVTAPDDTPDIDFSLELGGTISGIVTDAESGSPIGGATISVFDYGPGSRWGKHLSGLNTAQDGSYTTSPLPEGDYCILATAPGYGAECYEGSVLLPGVHSLPVTVTELNDTPDIDIHLDPAGTISGTVYDDSILDPLSDITITVCTSFGGTVSWSSCVTDGEGDYEVSAPYGEWYLRAGELQIPTGGYGVQYQGPVTVSETSNPTGIDFYLETAGGTISGTVYEDGTGHQLSNVAIQVATSSDYGCSNCLLYGIAMSDSNGDYEVMAGLPPGEYYVSAIGPSYVTQYYSDSLTWQDATQVADGSSNIDFSLATAAGTVKGHVYEGDGVTPIRNARVDVFTLDDKHITSCYASSRSGRYAVQWEKVRPVLPEGNLKACASASGYLEQWRNFTINSGEDTVLDFNLAISIPALLELCEGINTIAYTGVTTSLPEALTNIGPGGLDVVDGLWARGAWTGGEWLYYNARIPYGTLSQLEAFTGYTIIITEDCTWELPQ